LGASILLLSFQDLPLQEVFLISILSLPATLYSLYYQAFSIKKWCFLCLSIVAIIWAQAGAFFYFQDVTIVFELQSTLTILFSFLSVFFIWNTLKPKYDEAVKNKGYKVDYYKFKRKFSLFSTLLNKDNPKDTVISGIDEIVFGNKNSELEIVLITNPFCGHCRPVHKVLEDVLNHYGNDVKIIVRFNIPVDDLESDVVKITSNLLRLYIDEGEETCLVAMGQIYEGKPVKEWLKKWEVYYSNKEHHISLQQQKSWCLKNKINFTPEILINGSSFPKEYDRADLIYFIEDLHEEASSVLTMQETI
jgi:thiol-disulfide isomerase/thioredoxin